MNYLYAWIVGTHVVNFFLDYQIGYAVKRDLFNKTVEFNKFIFEKCQYNVHASKLPIKWEEEVYGNRHDNYQSFMIPGVFIT